MAQAVLVLLAARSGEDLAAEVEASGLYGDLVAGEDGVPKVLLGMNGVPVLNYWMEAVSSCPRLQPLSDHVFIVTNPRLHGALVQWASTPALSGGGFPATNIVDVGASRGPVADLAAFMRTHGPLGSPCVVAEADTILEPGFNLRRVLEHAIIRGKDAATHVYLPRGEPLAEHTLLQLDDASDPAAARVVAAAPPGRQGGASEGDAAALGPLLVLRGASMPAVDKVAAAALPAAQQLAALIAELQASRVVCSLPLAMAFSLHTLAGLHTASAFYAYYLAQQSAPPGGPAAAALAETQRMGRLYRARLYPDIAAAEAAAAAPKPIPPLDASMGGAMRDMYLRDFWPKWAAGELDARTGRTVPGGSGAGAGGVSAASARYGLPLRFADPTTRRHAPHAQHPLHYTSNNQYGARATVVGEMPSLYAPANSKFTKSFPDSAMRTTGLVTAVTTSRVHKTLDDF